MRPLHSALYIVPIVLGCALLGCESSQVASGPTPVKCEVSLSSSPISMDSTGGAASLSVTTTPECAWTVSAGDAPWISQVSPMSGQGSGSIDFRVEPNPLTSGRQGALVVNGTRVAVVQAAGRPVAPAPSPVPAPAPSPAPGPAPDPGPAPAPGPPGSTPKPPPPAPACTFVVSPTNISVKKKGSKGETVSVTAPASCSWTAASNTSWVGIASGSSGSGNGTVSVSIEKNNGKTREGSVTIAGQLVTVGQNEKDE
jgi:hypothetical protein